MAEHDVTVRHGGQRAPVTLDRPPSVAGYVLGPVLGRGGMGMVYRATELRFDREVALKVHLASVGDVVDMWKEAKLTAKVNDPGVVKIFDVGHTLDGRPYYAMELVEGTDLRAILRDGRIETTEALRICIETTRAVAAAHDKGIVHRDLKPRNVMIDEARRARVLDFGIAVRTAVTADSELVAGSPPYMPPEQIAGHVVGPAADIYAIGVMLFEMLTGRRPFDAADETTLIRQIGSEPAPRPSTLTTIHPDLEAIVLRCLEKSPADRFQTGASLVDALEAVRDGRPPPGDRAAASRRSRQASPSRPPPKVPRPSREDARTFSWSWELKAPPSVLWPLVADTDRFNEAVGLGTMDVEIGRESPETLARAGKASALGLSMQWREYPFEWVRDREHSVFRWYREGPLEALWNKVRLEPSGTGTVLTHEIALIPRGVLGRVAVAVEIGQRLRRAMDRVYRHIDDVVAAGGRDPYEHGERASRSEAARIEAGARQLARTSPPGAVHALTTILLEAPARKLTRMRPFLLAHELGVSREEALALMLHAAHVGLLEIAWDVVCPTCLVAHETERHLGTVKERARCQSCETEYHQDLCSSVELVFRAHPEVRETTNETYCAGSPARRPHIYAQVVLEPGEIREVTVDLPRGEYAVGAFGVASVSDLACSPIGHSSSSEIVVREDALVMYPAVVREGEVKLRIVNETDDERSVRIETRAAREDAVPAVVALTHPVFRDFFSAELLEHGELVGVSHLYFLVVDASDRGALFGDKGDAEACSALRAFEASVARCARDEAGTMIPGTLETLVVAFPSGLRALRAATSLLEHADLPVRLALNGGRCLALTRDLRIDYFGETLHRALWLVSAARPNELLLSHAAASDREIAMQLHDPTLTTEVDTATAGPYQGRRVVRVRRAPRT